MRVLLDTNVLLAGFFSRGLCQSVLDYCADPDHCTLITSDPILDEFERIATIKFRVPAEKLAIPVGFLRRHATVVKPALVPADSCPDTKDLHVLGAAVAGSADVLVSGDNDLLRLISFQKIPIISPRSFYSQAMQQHPPE